MAGRKMSGGISRRTSEIIDHVKDCVEKCLQMYMSKRETINFLSAHQNIEPGVTEIIWEALERENEGFFRAYYVRLAVQNQIKEFNRLLQVQAEEHIRQRGLAGNANAFNSDGSHTTQQISTPNVVQGSRHLEREDTL